VISRLSICENNTGFWEKVILSIISTYWYPFTTLLEKNSFHYHIKGANCEDKNVDDGDDGGGDEDGDDDEEDDNDDVDDLRDNPSIYIFSLCNILLPSSNRTLLMHLLFVS